MKSLPSKKTKMKKKMKRNPSKWTSAHKVIMTRLYLRPEDGPVSKMGRRALIGLQDEGFAKIVSISEAYQDPEAGPEEGEVLLWDVKAKITPAGKLFMAQSGMLKEAKEQYGRVERAMRGKPVKTPSRNPGERQRNDYLGDAVALAKERKSKSKKVQRRRKGPPPLPVSVRAKKKPDALRAANPKTPEWQRLIRRCQKLWEHYSERPGKKRLQAVLDHLEKMKASSSKKVADERKRCLRSANLEAKRLKLKR